MNTVRIIAGKWRSRKITFPDKQDIRPTPDRVRETLFNWLAPTIVGGKCLDLFSGSGALGFEALSRGAAKVVMTDASSTVIKKINENAKILGATNLTVILGNIPKDLSLIPKDIFDIVFIDPPYHKNLVKPTCDELEKSGLLADDALIYIETENSVEIKNVIPEGWEILKSKGAGQVSYNLIQRHK
jgi:16S rRNA (guanine966-N2)-methyltransferase